MRTLTAIVLTAVLATPAAALSIVKVMSDTSAGGSELSVQERGDQLSKLKSKGGSKSKKRRAPLFDTVRNTQIG